MFFVLSKILSFLTAPTTWIFILFVAYFVFKRKKWRNKLLISAIILLGFFTNPFLATYCFDKWEVDPIPLETLEKHDIAVVFSGMTITEKKLNDRIYFNKAADRILMAVHLYKIGKVNKILISGGKGKIIDTDSDIIESESLKGFLLMLDIPEKDIIQEKKANNTYENAVFTKELLDKKYPNSKNILITSAFHIRRSYGCAQKVGLNCTPFAVDYHVVPVYHSLERTVIPASNALYNWDILFHETIGYLIYWITGKL